MTENSLKNYRRLKFACYSGNILMSVCNSVPPILFMSFRDLYGISYSFLGLLVLINFCSQLLLDLIFSFFSHKFDISKAIKSMPIFTFSGLSVYALAPVIFPNAVYVGLAIGTMLFSTSCGLSEVLISPIFAKIPSNDPDREMSKLHSVYSWGAATSIIIGALFITVFGSSNWQIFVLILAALSLVSFVLFFKSDIPQMETPEKFSGAVSFIKDPMLWICFIAIFLGGAAECTMSQWSSGYLEQAVKIPKLFGDVFGTALFAVAIGIGRSLYGKYGRNVEKVLILGSIGATLCYVIAAVSPYPIIALFACAFTGFCTSMLWTGNLLMSSKRFATSGVFIFAFMAAGGDLGASAGPQLVGIVTDIAMENPGLIELARSLQISSEQLGMKLGMFVGALFPLLSVLFLCIIRRKNNSNIT